MDRSLMKTKTRGDQRGGTYTNERSHMKLITIGSNRHMGGGKGPI